MFADWKGERKHCSLLLGSKVFSGVAGILLLFFSGILFSHMFLHIHRMKTNIVPQPQGVLSNIESYFPMKKQYFLGLWCLVIENKQSCRKVFSTDINKEHVSLETLMRNLECDPHIKDLKCWTAVTNVYSLQGFSLIWICIWVTLNAKLTNV